MSTYFSSSKPTKIRSVDTIVSIYVYSYIVEMSNKERYWHVIN